ncbi:hypothetical protein MtrunA17_Chr6g0460651 [Medicago truncatula]|uniref:Transmembrane protein n=1 Tax=Medicago truncatula TaxID=3880 RepID=A0A396HDL4_MEDTR|nr:uncharacterized protein LOC112422581 [Medicago truncatula]RHN50728.1 hypothetical protein MtrunA17_Chr6g0460651 [Medicago truncatula]
MFNMLNKFPLRFLFFFIVFSCFLLASSSLQTTRNFFSKDEKSSIQTTLDKESVIGFSNGEDLLDKREEFLVKKRMNLEIEDYPGTGANNHHDPKVPGRV